ncbi:MAG: NYN domain-containing protein [Chloroflexi bacterium]|nr:NYN domain-containing protein [Chloroflexota bacterium]
MTIGIDLRNRVALLIDRGMAPIRCLQPLVEFADFFGKVITLRSRELERRKPGSPASSTQDRLAREPVAGNPIGKNATDHRMLVEIGELLVDTSWTGEDVNVFIIVSGDGDFASACRYIREKGRAAVIGLGGDC